METQKSPHDPYASFKYPTLQQYISDFQDVLEYYKKQNEDNDKMSFLINEIRLLKEHIRPVLQNEKTELEKQCGLDLEIYQIKNHLASYNKILAFLENEKSNLEIQLIKNDDISKIDLPDSSIPTKTLSFTNNFDNVKESVIIKYFTESLVDKKYLTALELEEFLIAAFDKRTPPTHRFNFNKLGTQQLIKKVFYNYYKIIASKPYGEQPKYAELLGEYFVGFNTNSLLTNFSK